MVTMSDPLGGWISGVFALDPSTGSLMLPLWAAGALTALFVVACVVALNNIGRDGIMAGIGRVALVMLGAALAGILLQGINKQDVAAERRALESRAGVLATRATMPGSPLACLDAMAGDPVEGSCERTLFASPEAMASAVSYAAAQVSLFVDVSRFVKRGHSELEPLLAALRRAVESDRYGLVAHVLATRDSCTGDRCPALALMHDAQRVSSNLAQRTYDFYVGRHSAAWPAPAPAPVADAAPAAAGSVAGVGGTAQPLPPGATAFAAPGSPRSSRSGADLFFPNSETIPPVNIMTAEPGGDQSETTGSTPPRMPPRRPAQKDQSKQQQAQKDHAKQQAPIDLNAAARGAPAATAQ
jgi:hypothetical protein